MCKEVKKRNTDLWHGKHGYEYLITLAELEVKNRPRYHYTFSVQLLLGVVPLVYKTLKDKDGDKLTSGVVGKKDPLAA